MATARQVIESGWQHRAQVVSVRPVARGCQRGGLARGGLASSTQAKGVRMRSARDCGSAKKGETGEGRDEIVPSSVSWNLGGSVHRMGENEVARRMRFSMSSI